MWNILHVLPFTHSDGKVVFITRFDGTLELHHGLSILLGQREDFRVLLLVHSWHEVPSCISVLNEAQIFQNTERDLFYLLYIHLHCSAERAKVFAPL